MGILDIFRPGVEPLIRAAAKFEPTLIKADVHEDREREEAVLLLSAIRGNNVETIARSFTDIIDSWAYLRKNLKILREAWPKAELQYYVNKKPLAGKALRFVRQIVESGM